MACVGVHVCLCVKDLQMKGMGTVQGLDWETLTPTGEQLSP